MLATELLGFKRLKSIMVAECPDNHYNRKFAVSLENRNNQLFSINGDLVLTYLTFSLDCAFMSR